MAGAKAGSGSGPSKGNPNGAAADTGAASRASGPKRRREIRAASAEPRDELKERRRNERERTPLNSIRPSRPRQRSSREAWSAENGVRSEKSTESRGRTEQDDRRGRPSSGGSTDAWAIPDSVKDRFTQEGRGWYFPDGTRAFRDHGRRLTTRSENSVVIASLVEIAQARGWDSVTISRGSSERFRQEVWKQAKLAGLEVRGYRPSEAEKAALIRALSRRADEARPQDFALRPPPHEAATEQQEGSQVEGKPPRSARRDAQIAGKLLDHGADHYRFDPKADLSYYIRVQTKEGRRTIWSEDFQRAVKHSLSQVKIGDDVVIQHRGAVPVTVTRQEFDANGNVIGEKEVSTHRNSWSVERSDFVAQRENAANALRDPSLSPARVAQKHPELVGTLLQLRAAQLAARRFNDPRDREAFVAIVRDALADQVARGEPLRPVQLRESRERRTPPERNQAPAR